MTQTYEFRAYKIQEQDNVQVTVKVLSTRTNTPNTIGWMFAQPTHSIVVQFKDATHLTLGHHDTTTFSDMGDTILQEDSASEPIEGLYDLQSLFSAPKSEQRFVKLAKDGCAYSDINAVLGGRLMEVTQDSYNTVEEALAITTLKEAPAHPIPSFFITGQSVKLIEVLTPAELIAGDNTTQGPWRILKDLTGSLWIVGQIYREATKQEEEEINIQEEIRLRTEAEYIASLPETEQEDIKKMKASFEQLMKQLEAEEKGK